MLREYYEARGLSEDGRPLQAVLEQAGLAEVGAALHRGT
jgi:aldehyde:ferredoxin oxidoreductase